jgi:excisionase family DNA binding protein
MNSRLEQPDGEVTPLVYSVEEAADVLGIGRTFMFRLCATGEVESFKIGKKRKILRHALDAYIERQVQAEGGGDTGRGHQ